MITYLNFGPSTDRKWFKINLRTTWAGYDFFENDHNIDHETEISELFLSWGWKHNNKK